MINLPLPKVLTVPGAGSTAPAYISVPGYGTIQALELKQPKSIFDNEDVFTGSGFDAEPNKMKTILVVIVIALLAPVVVFVLKDYFRKRR